jgi:hypothetical protein
MSRLAVPPIGERVPVSRAGPARRRAGRGARCGPAVEEVIAVAGAAGSGTASAKSARVGCSGHLVAAPEPGRVRLLPGWSAGQGWLQPPSVVVV